MVTVAQTPYIDILLKSLNAGNEERLICVKMRSTGRMQHIILQDFPTKTKNKKITFFPYKSSLAC